MTFISLKLKIMHYEIRENSWIAKIASKKLGSDKVAIVLGKTIHLCNTGKEEFLNNKRWLKHELCHIEQFKQHGFVPFILKYLLESIRKGYTKNKYEIEAREAENKS